MYIGDAITKGDVVLKHISTIRMIADPLSKPTAMGSFRSSVKVI